MGYLETAFNAKWALATSGTFNGPLTISQGRVVYVDQGVLKIDKEKSEITLATITPHLQYTLSLKDAIEYIQKLDAMSRKSTTYADLKDNSTFNVFYPREMKNLLYFNGEIKNEATRTCTNCGVVLPVRLLQMDHQRPKIGGQIEAVVKVMRILQLTLEEPRGPKCRQLHNAFIEAKKHPTNPWILIFTHQNFLTGTIKPTQLREESPPGNLDDRYTLNNRGSVLYAILRHFGMGDLLDICLVNGIANIRPLCSACNGGRSNKDRKYPPV
ncbi:hypothetical protein G7Z17_g2054 [Cylindrodendrum hubeiense]|uniref:Uncharacterized protein n=1 Tax=Cylindrodendrum hubeiense TaxID=595255 RepID=A0A9P5HNZ3_9HYPO|nr:hypothetical protein G7Z17_g2054 [Cylindrodendrum hubeiense]